MSAYPTPHFWLSVFWVRGIQETCLSSKSLNNISGIQGSFMPRHDYLQTNIYLISIFDLIGWSWSWRLLFGLRLAGNNCFSMFYLSSTVFHKIILSTQIMECVNEIGWWLRSWNISTFWEILFPILIIFCFPIYLFSGYSITDPKNLKALSLS